MFLENGKNKTMLISFLVDNLQELEYNISDATADVDTFIANIAVQEGKNGSDNIVHGDDVDIFWLLIQGHFRRSVLTNFQNDQ